MSKISPNAPCPCGSGKKYKRCCGAAKPAAAPQSNPAPAALVQAFQSWVKAGQVAQQAGNLAEADTCYDRALNLIPDDPGVLGLKAARLHADGEHEAALPWIRRAIAAAPAEPRLYELLGQILLSRLYHTEAERAFGQVLRLAPDTLSAWKGMGLTQLERGKLREALASFAAALRLQATDPASHFYRGKAFYYLGDLEAADQAFQTARKYGSHAAVVDLWLSALSRRRGQIEASLAMQMQAQPGFPNMNAMLSTFIDIGRVEAESGHFRDAEYWLRMIIEHRPEEATAYIQLAGVRKFGDADRPTIERMEALLGAASLSDSDREGLEFALGKAWGDLDDSDASFSHYRAGNDLIRARVTYGADVAQAATTRMIAAFTTASMAALPPGNPSELPTLIVGMPRSGTTLTEQIISSHSQVTGAGEMDFWTRLAPQVLQNFPHGCNKTVFEQLAQGYLGLLREESATALRVTDKMPANFQYLGLIHAVFPKARIIHVRRHPIDTCLSIYFQHFKDGHAYKWDLESLASYYEQYHRLMAHWRSILPAGSIFELQYEDLVEDTEGVSKRLMDFIGLEWEPGQLAFHQQDRAVFTASKWQAKQPIYKTSKERWRRYERHLGPLLRLQEYA